MGDELRTLQLPAVGFDELVASVRFDDVTRGRRGAVLVKEDASGIPIVRTTTPYPSPAQRFGAVHDRLAHEIQRLAALPALNNALIEHYTRAYSTMKRHSDQALDLADDSSIAVYSCYRDPSKPSRRLVVKPKDDRPAFDVLLAHGSVVVFSLDANRRFTHTIALTADAPDTDWLGVTLRSSKSFVRFVDGSPCLGGVPLMLATEEQRRDFFQLRRRENDEVEFRYPPIAYTISESDLQPPLPPLTAHAVA